MVRQRGGFLKNIILILLCISTQLTYAKTCLCQYPTLNAKFGKALKSEISLYKLSCKVWLLNQRQCRLKKTIPINKDLINFIPSDEDLVSIGFVGHWRNSLETSKYLISRIAPLIEDYGISIRIENTGCYPMKNPYNVFKTVKGFDYKNNNYLTFIGPQVRSIGLWEKLNPLLSKVNINAMVDSRKTGVILPSCSRHIDQYCPNIQFSNYAYCSNGNRTKTISCVKSKKFPALNFWRYKDKKSRF